MAVRPAAPHRRLLTAIRRCAAVTVAILWAAIPQPAGAERSAFRTYDAEQGLVSFGGSCMMQDGAGYILVCTEHGVFAYDGRRFANLGPDQGLRAGGFVFGLALSTHRRIAVQYSNEVLVSDRSPDASHPPRSLTFRSVAHPGLPFDSQGPHRMAPWRDGFVLLGDDAPIRIVVPDRERPHAEPMPYNADEQARLRGAQAVFSVRGHLWEAFDDDRLCRADPGSVTCYGSADGLQGGPWFDVIADGDQVLARSASSVATFDPASTRWRMAALPDQGDRYLDYLHNLGLFRTPDGNVSTQADHGLAVLHPDGWHAVSVEDGAPPGTIVSAITDAGGQFWLQSYGRGLLRWIDYGHWETMERAEGLSDSLPWQSVRLPDGTMWLATDTGLDEIVRRDGLLGVGRIVPGPSFALAAGPHGRLWASSAIRGIRIIDPASGSSRTINVPAVDVILPDSSGLVWVGTETGLFRVDARSDVPGAPVRQGPHAAATDVMADGAGGVFYFSGGHLRHHHADDRDEPVSGTWPDQSFSPIAMARGRDGSLWAGGAGGLFRFMLQGDRVASCQAVGTDNTQSNTVLTVMVDRRGWVWAGTTLGISVFDGRRWVSTDADGGLLSNDVQQLGLREDPDGSVWISTSRGLTRIRDPASLFDDRPIKVVISDARLGADPVMGNAMPYSIAALSLQFGTPDYAVERSVVFRYHLSGVDAGWVETATGTVRYPFVPPGRHLLTVVSYDQLTHRTSTPVELVVDMGFPWWRQWWAELLWTLCVICLIYGLLWIRFRVILARQAELNRRIAEATEQLRDQTRRLEDRTEQLHYQAAHDSLTGLFNRSEIERRLAIRLAESACDDEMIVALMDIDHFKSVNDRHGHLGGDDVLRAVGGLTAAWIQPGELAGRYGGEEILLVLNDADGSGAGRVLDLHRDISVRPLPAAGASISITCSIGLAWARSGDDWESLVGRADEALYQAKREGRNQVIESRRIDRRRVDRTTTEPEPPSIS